MRIELTHIYTKKRPEFSMVEILILKSVRNLVYLQTKPNPLFKDPQIPLQIYLQITLQIPL
jgi:hypothetical protein